MSPGVAAAEVTRGVPLLATLTISAAPNRTLEPLGSNFQQVAYVNSWVNFDAYGDSSGRAGRAYLVAAGRMVVALNIWYSLPILGRQDAGCFDFVDRPNASVNVDPIVKVFQLRQVDAATDPTPA